MNDQLWIAALLVAGAVAEGLALIFIWRDHRQTEHAVEGFESHMDWASEAPRRQPGVKLGRRLQATEIMLWELSASLTDRMRGLVFLVLGLALTMSAALWALLRVL